MHNAKLVDTYLLATLAAKLQCNTKHVLANRLHLCLKGHCLCFIFRQTSWQENDEEEKIIIITTRWSELDLFSVRWDPGSCLPGGLWDYIHSFVHRRNKNYKEGQDNSNYGVCCDDISSYMQKCIISAHAV